MGNSNTLLASLLWSSLGLGFVVYGKRQGAFVPLLGGLMLVAISYFIESALYMSVAGAGLVIGIVCLRRRFD